MRIPHKNLQIHWGPVEFAKKIKVRSHICIFDRKYSQNFETGYKITVVDKKLVSNIPKFRQFYNKMKDL